MSIKTKFRKSNCNKQSKTVKITDFMLSLWLIVVIDCLLLGIQHTAWILTLVYSRYKRTVVKHKLQTDL